MSIKSPLLQPLKITLKYPTLCYLVPNQIPHHQTERNNLLIIHLIPILSTLNLYYLSKYLLSPIGNW